MRKILTLSLTLLALQSFALEMELKPALPPAGMAPARVDLELDIFGVSYHSNRTYGFNETNYGVGFNAAMSSPTNDHFYMVVSTGTYKDSYDKDAFFFMVGPRAMIGYRNGLHATASVQGGYLRGSGAKGQGILPIVSFGYDRVDVCVTGTPFSEDNNSNSADNSNMVAVFLKFRVFEF